MKQPMCLQHHDRPAHCRGRCRSCYESIMRDIRNGKMTDKQAVRNRWLLPQVWKKPKARKATV